MRAKSALVGTALSFVVIVGGIIGAASPVFIPVAGIVFWMADPRAPSDRELISIFQKHRTPFENLRDMSIADEVYYVHDSRADGRAVSERQQQYRSQ